MSEPRRPEVAVSAQPVIRPYEPADEDAAVAVWAQAGRRAHPFIPGEGEGERERKMREIYLVHADNWVVESHGRVVALLGLLDGEIGGLFVDPDAQGEGLGRLLVEHAATLHGALTLEVYEKNTPARRFYARMGFEEESRRADEEYDEVMLKLARPAPEDRPHG
ncbi:GNAT family N-acetyltransferase [Streptomyces sp. SID3343]|uniref:GNAT family N-acetyltransferase n=1 Tax=Streptomyces sp. SID3343 TaxID=2690260 RepID=UPI00136B07E6|nr:GNAT family N-acetyltransferase [Streptomyces sp. SID3343]MYW00606.1 GNAT family N-acetyltransferase [Streptomyces sp. SID3343]